MDNESIGFEMLERDPYISLHAINGFQSITNYYGKKTLQLLLDLSSTHNFLDVELANRLRCTMEPIALQREIELQCQSVCRNFRWKLRSTKFYIDEFLIPLGSCDVILGVQWLSTLATIKWNF